MVFGLYIRHLAVCGYGNIRWPWHPRRIGRAGHILQPFMQNLHFHRISGCEQGRGQHHDLLHVCPVHPVCGDSQVRLVAENGTNRARQQAARANFDKGPDTICPGLPDCCGKIDPGDGLPGQRIGNGAAGQVETPITCIGIESHTFYRPCPARVQFAPGGFELGHHRRMNDEILIGPDRPVLANRPHNPAAIIRRSANEALIVIIDNGHIHTRILFDLAQHVGDRRQYEPVRPAPGPGFSPQPGDGPELAANMPLIGARLFHFPEQSARIAPGPESDHGIGFTRRQANRGLRLDPQNVPQQTHMRLTEQGHGPQLIKGYIQRCRQQWRKIGGNIMLGRQSGTNLGKSTQQTHAHAAVGRRCAGKDKGQFAIRRLRFAIEDMPARRPVTTGQHVADLHAPFRQLRRCPANQDETHSPRSALTKAIHGNDQS